MDFFIRVYLPPACAAIQFQVGFVTLRLDKQWPTSSAISNLKPFESLPTNSHVVYMREINHLRRLKWEDAGKGGLTQPLIREKAVPKTPGNRLLSLPAHLPPAFSHPSGRATVPITSSQRPVDDIFKWLRFFGLDSIPPFATFQRTTSASPFCNSGWPSSCTTTVSHNGSQSSR